MGVSSWDSLIFKILLIFGEFPSELVVRTWCWHCCGLGSIPGWGTEIPQAARWGKKKNTLTIWKLNKKNIKATLITRRNIVIIVFFLNIFLWEFLNAHESREDTMMNPDVFIAQIWQSLISTHIYFSCFFLFWSIFKLALDFMSFHPQILHLESQLLEDISLDNSNPKLTPTRLTIITLISSTIQIIRDFPWLSAFVFYTWLLQPFL